MTSRPRHPARGSLLLVVMCFVAVLGIGLVSYLALCARTMTITNRSVQTSLTKPLAEAGLEEALRAFNKNDWSDWSNGVVVDWTLDTTNKRATASMAFPAGKFGQGVTASVKIRVDNYDSAQLSSAWVSGVAYRINDLVSYGSNGIWYRCIQSHTSSSAITPLTSTGYSNLVYWAPEPTPWSWTSNKAYTQDYDVVNYSGTWYRCSTTHTSGTSFTASSWTSIPAPVLAIYTNTSYTAGTFAYRVSTGTWYRCLVTHTVNSTWDATEDSKWSSVTTPYISWAYVSGLTYSYNSLIYFGGTWYRCKVTSTTSSPTAAPSDWDNALTGPWSWSSSITYNLNDAVYYGSRWYRSTAKSNFGNTPSSSSAYWSAYPLYSRTWDSSRQYSQNDTVYYNGVRYLSLQNSNYNQNPASQTSFWRSTSVAAYQWNSTTSYSSGTYQSYGGVWYKAVSTHSGKSPNNTAYWTPATSQSAGVTTGAAVAYAEATISIAGGGSTKTQLRTVLAPAPLFSNAVGATSTLTLSAGGTIDSYDSTVAAYSAGTAGYSAVLAASGSTSPAVTLTSPTINGYVAATSSSTTYAPMLTYGGSTVVRGTSTGVGVDLARISRSPYVPKMDILNVAGGTTLSLADSTSYTLGTPGATTPTVYNISSATNAPNVVLNNSAEVLTIVGPVILNISGNLNMALGKIVITSTGSAEIHLSGRLRIQSSTGGIQNLTSDPKKLIILGTSNLTTHVFQNTTYDFYGAIYLPNGALSIDNGPNIYGAISANSVTFTGNANVHYDTSLRYAVIPGVDQPYAPTEVRELTDALELATMP